MDDIFGCYYCGGMGYEDYPHNAIPCRVVEHQKRAEANHELARAYMLTQRKPHSGSDNPCPYCRATTACQHWTGLGWQKNREGAPYGA